MAQNKVSDEGKNATVAEKNERKQSTNILDARVKKVRVRTAATIQEYPRRSSKKAGVRTAV